MNGRMGRTLQASAQVPEASPTAIYLTMQKRTHFPSTSAPNASCHPQMTLFTTQTNTPIEKLNREMCRWEPPALGNPRQVWSCAETGAGTKKGRGLEGWKGGLRFCKHDRNYMNHPNETQPSFLTKKQRRFSRRKQDCNDSRTTASFLKAFRHLIHFQNRALDTHSSLASMFLPLILLSTQAVHSQLPPNTETEG